jgi:hypothetical protein
MPRSRMMATAASRAMAPAATAPSVQARFRFSFCINRRPRSYLAARPLETPPPTASSVHRDQQTHPGALGRLRCPATICLPTPRPHTPVQLSASTRRSYAMRSGPSVAPVSSSAVFTAYTHPLPCCPVEYDSIASTVGLRIARPMRSARMNAPATCQLAASAIAGTANAGDDADRGGVRAQRSEERTVDARAPLVRHIAKRVDQRRLDQRRLDSSDIPH